MKSLLVAVLFFTAAIAESADPSAEVFVYRSSLSPASVNLETRPTVAILSNPPHRQLNPEHKTSRFEGVSIKTLLGLKKRDANMTVHFIGADGYISSVPASVLLKTNAVLALKKDGERLTDRQGGVQVVYPTESGDVVESRYAKKAAFWCWYVRAIVVGDLPNTPGLSRWRLTGLKEVTELFPFEPPSVFQFQKKTCPKTIRIPLNQLTRSERLSVRRLSGQTNEIRTEQFDLLASPGGAALSVNCGGPFGIVDRAKVFRANTSVLASDLVLGISDFEERK